MNKKTNSYYSQWKAAKVAGFMFLFVMITYVFSDFLLSDLIVSGDISSTANNIQSSEGQFRTGTAIHLICSTSIVILALSLYVVLKPVSNSLATLGLLWRAGEAILGGVIALCDLFILSLLIGGDYVNIFESNQVYALAGVFLSAHYNLITISIVFSCLGASIFNYLLFKSGYIPRLLSGWGIFSSLLALTIAFSTIVMTQSLEILQFGYLPIFTYEIMLALWFLAKGIKVQ